MTDLKLGNIPLTDAGSLQQRLSMLLWGEAGDGKTTLAATAPGKKLWINFDPDGPTSIAGLANTHSGRTDTVLSIPNTYADFSGQTSSIVEGFRRDDHLGLGKILGAEDCDIDTVVVDSVTRFSQLALELAVKNRIGGSSNWTPSLETPGQTGYGARNTMTYRMFADIFTVTKKYNKHVIFITHEKDPTTNDKGETLFITMMLGGQLPKLGSSQVSEVWHLAHANGKRRISVQPCRMRKPMKTRMFNADIKSPEFDWVYDINNPDPRMEINTWWNDYIANQGKIPLPKV